MKKTMYGLILVVVAVLLQAGALSVDTYAKYVGTDSKTVTINVQMPQYTVIFNSNSDNTTGSMNTQTITYGTPVALAENAFEKEDYVFVNWNTDPDGEGTSYEDEEVIDIQNALRDSPGSVTLYAQWEYSPMPIVFQQTGVCEFHGEVNGVPRSPITGDDCEYAGQYYIDTGWKLYSQENYTKDFEIGFKIVEYNSQANVDQATFASSKYESGSTNSGNPGFAIRKGNNNTIEITQMIRINEKAAENFPAGSVTEVKLARVDEKIYYSINGGDYIQLQSNVGTSDYHEIPMWFGAAPTNEMIDDTYVAHRYLEAKLSDIYIKVGNFDIYKHKITYHANGEGATVSPEEKVYLGDSTIGPMPVPTRTGHAFEGWYTAPEGGTKVRADDMVTDDMDLYAHWSEDTNICEVHAGGNTFRGESITACIAAAGTTDSATITILADIHENVTVGINQDITFDLGDNVWSDGGNAAVITNKGKVHIINGRITSSQNNAVINNVKANNGDPSPELCITGGEIVATGAKQAVYNVNGRVEISGNAYLSSTSGNRATLHSLTSGSVVILGGTIESKGFAAIRIESSSQPLIIGKQGNGINTTTPVIRGASNGIIAEGNIKFYDGIIMGSTSAVSNRAKIVDHDGDLTDGETEIDEITYYTLYNE